ncbi:11616_t:CDS:2, partial [Racocetra persica]
KYFKDKNKKTASHLSVNIFENLQPLLSTKVPTVVVETPAINKTTSHLSTNISEELQYLLNTEVSMVVVETPAIDIKSDSDDLSPLFTTEVPIITDLELTNTQSNLNSCYNKTKHHDMGRMDQTCRHYNQFLGRGISNFRIYGQVYHLIRSLLPNEGLTPIFAQLYIYDTANEITNRRNIINRNQDIRHYNAPTALDIAAIMVDDGHKVNLTSRDIILRTCDRNLQRISEFHPSYDPLYYILLFSKGDDG